MMRLLSILMTALLLPFMAMATDPPSPQLHKGQWKYHATITIDSGAASGHTVERDWAVCTTGKKTSLPSLLPNSVQGNTKCSEPVLQTAKGAFHTTMTCVTLTDSMQSTVKQDMSFTPANGGDSVDVSGKVHQELSGPSIKTVATDMSVRVSGKHTGDCK